MLSATRYEIVSVRTQFGVVAAVAALCAGCGASHVRSAATTNAPQPPVLQKRACIEGSYHVYPSRQRSWAGVVRNRAIARRSPGGAVLASFGRMNVNHVPTVFWIRGARVSARCKPTWYRVQLPIRPNGVNGWVPARALVLATVRTRIVVDLSARRLSLFRNGKRVLSAKVAVGSSATPTPVGRFYVNQRLIPYDKGGPYGPGAVGISAYSNVLTGWTQGGPVAIHGTNEPWSIGRAVSNGCIRLRNPILRRVFNQTLAGTPVTIHA
jgi:lipoprotein-anchoring transpeptidase ErfK/SrfK